MTPCMMRAQLHRTRRSANARPPNCDDDVINFHGTSMHVLWPGHQFAAGSPLS
jgi:hypothetical protein